MVGDLITRYGCGECGQDRESYSDTQDRDSYAVDPALGAHDALCSGCGDPLGCCHCKEEDKDHYTEDGEQCDDCLEQDQLDHELGGSE